MAGTKVSEMKRAVESMERAAKRVAGPWRPWWLADALLLVEIETDRSPIVACIDHEYRPRLAASPRVKRAIVRAIWAGLSAPLPAGVRS
jgi:hypothetical protein